MLKLIIKILTQLWLLVVMAGLGYTGYRVVIVEPTTAFKWQGYAYLVLIIILLICTAYAFVSVCNNPVTKDNTHEER